MNFDFLYSHLKITDFESGSEPLKATLSRGGIWRFDIDGVDYLLEIIRWPRNTDDTIIFNVKLAPPLPEMQAIDTSTGIAAVRDTCLSYNVTFTEIDIRDYSKSPADSVQLLFKAEPHSKLIWLTFDTLGIYPLSISFNYVATRSGNVVWGMEFIAPKVKGYVWPTVSGSWPRNDPSINRVHVDTADNKFITYILKYEIECEKEL
ncbi:MAG: hypothetical protein IIB00_02475 [candidate division Zixibacteria bacterium]|nr:hypothetical protein [candidate division Zixibacteria bacterium]